MEKLKEILLEEILNKSDVRVKEDFYISYSNIKQILNDNLVEYLQIINEKNLQDDFIEGVETLLKRELTVEEIENFDNSHTIEYCTNEMLQLENNLIVDYYKINFENKDE